MSFGFGVSDFVIVLQLANRVCQRFVDAPEQFKAISDEVRSLSIILDHVNVALPQRDLAEQQKAHLRIIVEGCHDVLETLDKTLEMYQELGPASQGSESKSLRFKIRRGWKSVKWEPKDVKELRLRIVVNISLLNTFNEQLTSEVSQVMKDRVERQAVVDWLALTDYSTHQSDSINRRQEGTGLWLLNSTEFQEWVNHSKKTLFCPGIPGAGKTIMSSIVVDHLNTKFESDAGVGIAYIYCSYQSQQKQKPEDLLMSLLKQLMQGRLSVPESVKSLYEHHKNKQARPSCSEIVKALHSTIELYSRVFIVIDALDEYHISNNEGLNRLLSEVSGLQDQSEVNFFATSRFISEITSQFDGCICKEIRAQDNDILQYINGRIPRLLRSHISKYPQVQDTIRSDILRAVDGMFLLAQLHMDSLMSQPTLGHVRQALKTLPRGLKGLDETYEQAMRRIECQDEGYRELAKQVLSWVTHAKRALSVAEVQHAVAVSVGMAEVDEEFLPEVEILDSVCAGLVTVNRNSNIIQLVHYTAQEYFERKSSFSNAETDITMACVTYLSFDTFATGSCPTDKEFEARLQLNPLYDYAARYWGYHARAATTEVGQLVLSLLESEAKVAGSSQAMMVPRKYSGYSQAVPRQMIGVHVVAYFGLREAMIALFENGYDPDARDTYGRTPLSWAAGNGHESVVKLLLSKEGVDPDSKDTRYGRTPLSWAAWRGYETVVKLLLSKEGVDPDSKDTRYGGTPLSWAAGKGHEAVVKLLLSKEGVDPDSRDTRYGWTPLSWAARRGHEAVVKLLLSKEGVDPDSKDTRYGRTPLSWAAGNGYETVVKLLFPRKGVDPDSKDRDYGRTPLSWAAEKGHEVVVKLLLAKVGVDPDSKSKSGRTPLSYAAERGHEAVTRLLLAKEGVDPDSKSKSGRTPLSCAAEKGHEAVIRLLLAKDGIDLDSKSKSGRTPLSWATEKGHEAVIRLLLAKDGVDPDSKSKSGRTPLSWAAEKGHEAVVRLLQSRGALSL